MLEFYGRYWAWGDGSFLYLVPKFDISKSFCDPNPQWSSSCAWCEGLELFVSNKKSFCIAHTKKIRLIKNGDNVNVFNFLIFNIYSVFPMFPVLKERYL